MSTHPANGANSPPPPNQSSVAMIARQAIVNAQHMVVGYELFNRSRTGAGHTAATDVILVFTALSHAGTEELVGKKLIFVNCTHESLAGGHIELVDPDKVVLEIPPLGHAASAEVVARLPILAGLRERGFHLAFNHTVLESAYAPWLPLVRVYTSSSKRSTSHGSLRAWLPSATRQAGRYSLALTTEGVF